MLAVASTYDKDSYAHAVEQAAYTREAYEAARELIPHIQVRRAMLDVAAKPECPLDLQLQIYSFVRDDLDGNLIWNACNGDGDLVDMAMEIAYRPARISTRMVPTVMKGQFVALVDEMREYAARVLS